MPTKDEPKTACRTPAEGRTGVTNIPTWKYESLRDAILVAIKDAGADGLAFKDLREAVRPKLSEDELSRMGKLGWHVTTVKLNMEVDGEILRVEGAKPQRLIVV